MSTHEDFMRRAIELSRENMLADEGGPFGAVVVRDGVIVGEGWNRVTSANDPTAHAEVVAIRAACDRLGVFSLEGATIYCSCEPCPMCLAAIYWARISSIYYANDGAQAAQAGFDDEWIAEELTLDEEGRSVTSERLLVDEAFAVFEEWMEKPDKIGY